MTDRISLVTMPWAQPGQASLLMGNLHSVLESAGWQPTSHSFFLDFSEIVMEETKAAGNLFKLDHYQAFVNEPGLGELVFAKHGDKYLREYEPNAGSSIDPFTFLLAQQLHQRIPAFLDACLEELQHVRPTAVIFCCHLQEFLVPSLALAERIRSADPNTQIVFAGDRLDGEAGEVARRAFAHVDAAIGLDPEMVVRSILTRGTQRDPDLEAARQSLDIVSTSIGRSSSQNPRRDEISFDSMPTPHYHEYFQRLQNLDVHGYVIPAQWLPYEMSRGCWWAEVSKCSFCGLTGTNSNFRYRSPQNTVDDLLHLVERHQVLQIFFADWVIGRKQVSDLEWIFTALPADCRYFLESRVDLSRTEFEILARFNVELQLGIETLSPKLLKLMRKGTQVISNLRALRWCAELGIPASWNLMSGHPGETEEDVAKIVALLPDLVHLPPPSLHRFRLRPMSPIHEELDHFGIDQIGPMAWHRAAFAKLDESDLLGIVDEYDFTPRQTNSEWTRRLADQVAHWQSQWPASGGSLWHETGPGFVHIHDSRPNRQPTRITLEGPAAEIFAECSSGKSARRITNAVFRNKNAESYSRTLNTLDSLLERGFVYQDGDRYLSLSMARSRHH